MKPNMLQKQENEKKRLYDEDLWNCILPRITSPNQLKAKASLELLEEVDESIKNYEGDEKSTKMQRDSWFH